MGVEGVFPYLEEKGVKASKVTPKIIQEEVDIDLMALYYSYIRATDHRLRYQEYRKSTPPASSQATPRLIRLLHGKLKETFGPGSVVHIDGNQTAQKSRARGIRSKRREEKIAELEDCATKIGSVIESLDTKPCNKRRRLIRLVRKAKQSWQGARVIDAAVKAAIAEGLESYGWTVCHCDGEADVCIGQKARWNPGSVVAASTDSDILFHGVKQLLRKDPRNHTFTSYHVEEILEKLEVTRSQWTVATVTTNNDYSAQVKSQTFSKNIETARASNSEDPAAVLEKYCTIMNVDNGRFGPSKDVFMDKIETIMTESTSNESIDLAMRGLVDRINVCFQRLKANQRADKSAAVVTAGRTGKASSNNVPATGRSRKQNRGFRSMVPPNKFTAKTFENKDPATTTIAATKVPRKRKKKEQDNRTRKRAPIFNKCSRKERRDPTENTVEPGRTYKLKPATVIQNCLMKYGTITMTCGTLSTQLRNGLHDNSVGRLDHREMFRKEVLETITEMIRIGTEVTRCAEQAVCLYISKVMAESTSLDDPDRRERLSTLGFHKDSGCFGNLLQEIFSWHDVNRKKGNKKDSAENSCMSNIITVYKDFLHDNNQDFPRLNDKIQTGLNAFLQLTGQRLADTLQIHYNRNITELINRVRENNQGWANGEGRLFLEDFNDDGKSNSGLHDPISTFWILNSHLPKDKQFAFFPEGGFSDKFFTITEEALLKVLLRDGNPSRKEFLRQEFGSQTSAVQYANEHPGDLVYRLFFSNNIKYNGVCLTNPGPNLPATLGLLQVTDESMEHYQGLLNSLANGSASKESREAFKEFVKEQLPNPAAQKEAIDQRANNRRYVIRGSITTNGHELQVPAYSMTQAAPRPSAKKPTTTRSRLQDVKDLIIENDVEDVFGEGPQIVVGIDPGIKSTATCCILASNDMNHPKNVNISQGSHTFTTKKYLDGLGRAKKKAGIVPLENAIKPVECPQIESGPQAPAWIKLQHSYQDHLTSVLQVQESLRLFYSSKMFKIKTFHRKQALRATEDRGIDKVIAATGCKGKPGNDSPRPLFVVGDGQFGVRKGQVLHQHFISRLEKKVKGLGLKIVCADEWRTSLVCCQCGQVGLLDGRTHKCSGCGKDRDRDHNAGHNIARATHSLIQYQKWPSELTRPQQQPLQ